MSYEKTTWQNGDTITAEKLNNIENGIKECDNYPIEIVTFSLENDTWIADKSILELQTAYEAGKHIVACLNTPAEFNFCETYVTKQNNTFGIMASTTAFSINEKVVMLSELKILYTTQGVSSNTQEVAVSRAD